MDTNKFLLEIDFRLNPLKQQEFSQHLKLLKKIPVGCPETVVYEDIDNPGNLLLVSKWTKLQELAAYMDSDTFRVLVGGMETLGTVWDFRILDLRIEVPERGSRFALRQRGLAQRPQDLR